MEVELGEKAYFIRQNSHKASLVAGRLLQGLVGKQGTYIVVNMLNASGLHANNQQRENGFRDFFKKLEKEKQVSIHTITHAIKEEFVITSEIESLLKKEGAKGVFVTNARSFLFQRFLRPMV